ncbi:hypothetical protein CEXT_100671 [Caerostris extrusa]|uniref:Uncharacterized protein n=1 Tax=Caerostris extrusa TaxID=172846 RepID=A0AAV4W7I2_CAEEX|nr:hypothetical protein CEXT_100671 [Caerostris extrusa]
MHAGNRSMGRLISGALSGKQAARESSWLDAITRRKLDFDGSWEDLEEMVYEIITFRWKDVLLRCSSGKEKENLHPCCSETDLGLPRKMHAGIRSMEDSLAELSLANKQRENQAGRPGVMQSLEEN